MAEKPLDIVDAFDYFKKKCDKFIKELGLIGWDIKYNLNHSKDINDASVTYNCEARQATINLYNGEYDKKFLRYLAKHETLHILLAPLQYACETTAGSNRQTIDSAEHSIIQTLMNTAFAERKK